MKIKNIINIGILTILLSNCTDKLVYNSVRNKSQCFDEGGYWYNNKCWKGFEDEHISKTKIDSIVSSQMEIIKKSKIVIDNQTYPLITFLPIEENRSILLITVYRTKDHYKTLIFPTGKKKIENQTLKTTALLFNGNAIAGTLDEKSKLKGTATVNVIDFDKLEIKISGKIMNNENGDSKDFSFRANKFILGGGNSHIKIKGNEAYLSGELGIITYSQIKNLIKNNSKVKTIVMTHIPGSVNDAVNVHTGRLLHENGFTTKVLSDSDIASGGVDLFCAGKRRIVEKGAKIGVHSWCCVNGLTAIEIPKEHPSHQYQLEYFTMALGSKKGPDFYFYTLESATFDAIHYMSDEEIIKWNIATDFIENN